MGMSLFKVFGGQHGAPDGNPRTPSAKPAESEKPGREFRFSVHRQVRQDFTDDAGEFEPVAAESAGQGNPAVIGVPALEVL